MAPSWMPQNIQKRIFRYVLNRLQVFSNVDLDNLDVKVGTNTELSLKDVSLDTERLSLPGVTLTSATVGNLNLSVGVGGVKVDASDLHFNVTLYSVAIREEDFTNLLSRTTADLAQSLLEPDVKLRKASTGSIPGAIPGGLDSSLYDSDEEDDGGEGTGYGFGEFPDVAGKLADAALSQVQVSLRNITASIEIDLNTKANVRISKIKFGTGSSGQRTLVVSDFELTKPASPAFASEGSDDGYDSNDDMDESKESQLMQSMIFSHAEASAMYMSAMSTLAESTRPEPEPLRLVWCDDFTLGFKGIFTSDISVNIGHVMVATSQLPPIIESLVRLLRRAHEFAAERASDEATTSSDPPHGDAIAKTGDQNTETGSGDTGVAGPIESISIKMVTLSLSDSLLPYGAVDEGSICIQAALISLSRKSPSSQLFTIAEISAVRGSRKLLTFRRPSASSATTPEDDLTVHVSEDSDVLTTTVLAPHPLVLALELDDVQCLLELVSAFNPISAELAKFPKTEPQTDSKSILLAKFNSIECRLVTETCRLELRVTPMSLEGGVLTTKKLHIDLHSTDSVKSDTIDVESLKLVLGPDETNHTGSHALKSKLFVDTVDAKIHQDLVVRFVKELSPLLESLPTSESSNGKRDRPRVRIQEPDVAFFIAVVEKVDGQIFPSSQSMGAVDIDIGRLQFTALTSGSLQLSAMVLFVAMDLSRVDPKAAGPTPLLYSANPQMKEMPMLSLELRDGMPELKFYNACVDYYTHLLKLFEEDPDSKAKGADTHNVSDSVETLREARDLAVPLFLVDCVIGLNPIGMPARALLVIKDSITGLHIFESGEVRLDLSMRRSQLLLIDDTDNLDADLQDARRESTPSSLDQVSYFLSRGFISVATISLLKVSVKVPSNLSKHRPLLDITLDGLTIASCADSTQILLQTINGLKPPVEASPAVRFHTEVKPVDVFADIEDDVFSGPNKFTPTEIMSAADFITDDLPSNLDFVESYYADRGASSSRLKWTGSSGSGSINSNESSRADFLLGQDLSALAGKRSLQSSTGDSDVSGVASASASGSEFGLFEHRVQAYDSEIRFTEDHFEESISASLSSSGLGNDQKPKGKPADLPKEDVGPLPLKIKIRVLSVVWNLHDGYDWSYTRDAISKAVRRVEVEADYIRKELDLPLPNSSPGTPPGGVSEHVTVANGDEEVEAIVGDILFNSIYIGLPAGRPAEDLRRAISRDLNGEASETASIASSARSTSTTHKRSLSDRTRRLGLRRSKQHKVKIELRDVRVDMVVYAGVNDSVPSRETKGEDQGMLLNKIDIKVGNMEIFDNVPTSTWNKFLGYMRIAGDRESDASVIHIVLDTVKPVPELPVSEVQLNVSVLPLRLYVDQDTLDFVTRFFEFKDVRFMVDEVTEEIFIQRVEIHEVKIKLDYKPKKVDYIGLKSGRSIEMMNFFTLDEADIILRHVVLYGINGFSTMSNLLNGIWMPDIRTTQLGGFVAGIAPVRSLVKLGGGVRDLLVIPLQEYQRDGRLLRGLQKGVWTFARSTTNELAKFGAKLASGTQAILESAEQAMGGTGASAREGATVPRRRYVSPYADDIDSEDDEASYAASLNGDRDAQLQQQRLVSLYANQPPTMREGLQLAYQSMGRNLTMARNAVMEIGTETAERGNAQGAVVAVARAAPIVLIRPVIGATEAVSKTLLGMTNQIEPSQLKDVQDKYKPTQGSTGPQ